MKKTLSLAVAGLFAAALSAAPYKNGDVVVFFGDSITHGGRYHAYLTDFYRTRFPERSIRFVNAGIGGDNARAAQHRIPEDIVEFAPTHVAFHFGMNDVGRGSFKEVSVPNQLCDRVKRYTEFHTNFANLVTLTRAAAPDAKFLYLTPTPYDDTAVIENMPDSVKGWARINNVGCNAGLAFFAGDVMLKAKADGARCLDWYTPLNGFLKEEQARDPHFMITRLDRVHPEELGHAVMAWLFLKSQNVPAVVSEVTVEAASEAPAKCANGKVTDLKRRENAVSFTLLAQAIPFPVPEQAKPFLKRFDVERTLNRETVTVKGLKAGTYALRIDGETVGTWSAEALANGVWLGFNEKTPQYRQARAVFDATEALWDRERILRNHHSARWFFYGRQPVDDIPALKAWSETKMKGGYFEKFVPGYLAYWPEHKAIREALWRDQEKVRESAKPVPHRYEIVPASL